MVFKLNQLKLHCPAVYLNRNLINYVEKITNQLGYNVSFSLDTAALASRVNITYAVPDTDMPSLIRLYKGSCRQYVEYQCREAPLEWDVVSGDLQRAAWFDGNGKKYTTR